MSVVSLPEVLAERLDSQAPAPRDGRYVICWLRVAVRGHENPALDVALTTAAQLGVPCFVYWALSERYPYASDRLHTFALQGARDLQRDLGDRGVGAVFHLATPRDRRPHLLQLAAHAAVVVADTMPVAPFSSWDRAVAKVAPLWRVDASLIAPLWLLPKPHTRAFTFRQAAAPLWRDRVTSVWHDVAPIGQPFVPDDLAFSPINLEHADIPSLVAGCEIDHGIGPVHHTVGGTTAGNARWRRFRAHGLSDYARRRNDPLVDGVSRMSAYLHFGHVSPFQIAREAAAFGGDGADKFLDELLTWRELGWHLCHHEPAHQTTKALPAWAVATLREHERDERPALLSWEQLARAQTGDALWDACQRSLLVHGELHNNLRMTWGKALVGWTPDAATALSRLFDLNNRYALDGRDPSSAAGILWCLGALDRPFTPPQLHFGTVRERSLTAHAARLDVDRYAARTRRPARGTPLRVAVVGAGVAGAACARALMDAGHDVVVFDKGRGPGGRCSTRQASDERRFDHGAQFFTATDERFARFVHSWVEEGVVARWTPKIFRQSSSSPSTLDDGGGDDALPAPSSFSRRDAERFVAVPGMSAVLKRMLVDVPVHFGTTVSAVVAEGKGARRHFVCRGRRGPGPAALRASALRPHEEGRGAGREPMSASTPGAADVADDVELGRFDAVVVAVPAPQAVALLQPVAPALAAQAQTAVMGATWAVLLDYDGAGPEVDFDVLELRGRSLRMAAREASKPGRWPGARWVLHGSAEEPSSLRPSDSHEQVIATLLKDFVEVVGKSAAGPVFSQAHLWRFAYVARAVERAVEHAVERAVGGDCIVDDTPDGEGRFVVCGDWCIGPRIEAAFLSGTAAAGRLLAMP